MTETELIRLPNGVRIALEQMPGLSTAAFGVWQRVGARWEPKHLNGIAHLFEHMAFKGAGARDARQFSEAIEAVGGSLNAATGYERTAYYARTLAEHAPFALDLIADILFEPHWKADDLEKEKGVVAQERGDAFDAPGDRVFELHQAALYPDQPLGRPILGEEATLANVSVETLHAFHAAHMSPERVIISIAGAFDRNAFVEAAEQRFGGLKSKPADEPEAARATPGNVREARRIEQTHLALSWKGAKAGVHEVFALRFLADVLGGGASSRLFQEVREERGLVYTIDAAHESLEDDGRLSVYASCSAKNAGEVVKIVQGELEALAAHGPTQEELVRVRTMALASMLMALEAPSTRADVRMRQVMLRDELLPYETIRQRYEETTAEEVRAAAQLALEGPKVAALVGPKAGHGALAGFEAH
ncbi:MAG: hypothetical protein A4S17_07575 [Proteobacteria bacterium HN_bin10]|nr:MAG: hypothetical protein A4S17_07575 [Proteobacteria bacterium HN_bin10]